MIEVNFDDKIFITSDELVSDCCIERSNFLPFFVISCKHWKETWKDKINLMN